MKKNLCLALTAALLSFTSPLGDVMANDKKVSFDLTGDLIISSGYHNFVKDMYGDVTGGLGWIGLGAGAQFKQSDQLSITPGVDMMLNYTSVNTSFYYGGYYFGSSSDSYINFILLPKIAARYKFNPKSSPFIEVELNDNIPSSGSDVYGFKSGGIGYGVMVGYEFKDGMRIQAGYKYIPVDTELNLNGLSIPYNSVNMGGFGLQVAQSF